MSRTTVGGHGPFRGLDAPRAREECRETGFVAQLNTVSTLAHPRADLQRRRPAPYTVSRDFRGTGRCMRELGTLAARSLAPSA
jgi:hypothetical protein